MNNTDNKAMASKASASAKKIDGLTEEQYFDVVVAEIQNVTDNINIFCVEHKAEMLCLIETLNFIKCKLDKIENTDVPNYTCSWDDAYNRVHYAIRELNEINSRMGWKY